MSQAPAGWYPQPDGTQRYWDGATWTNHISTGVGADAADAPAPEVAAPDVPVPEAPAPEAPSAMVAAAPEAPAVPAPAQPFGVQATGIESAPKKRKVWPWLVGAGVVILLLIVGVIVAVTMFAKNVMDGPLQAVEDYDQAWQNVDCDLMQGATTAAFQERNGFADCATFEATAQPFADSLGTYTVDVNSTSIENNTAVIEAEETWTDKDGGVTVYTYKYTLNKVGDTWLIESVEDIS